MKIRLSAIFIMMVATGCGFALFHVSQDVQRTESEFQKINTALRKERDVIRVLETEWDYLNRPDRIEDLTKTHLQMTPAIPGALVRDSADVPTATLPIPGRKPQHALHRDIHHAPAAKEDSAPAAPVKPDMAAPQNSRQQFNDLLNQLIVQEPASGENTP